MKIAGKTIASGDPRAKDGSRRRRRSPIHAIPTPKLHSAARPSLDHVIVTSTAAGPPPSHRCLYGSKAHDGQHSTWQLEKAGILEVRSVRLGLDR